MASTQTPTTRSRRRPRRVSGSNTRTRLSSRRGSMQNVKRSRWWRKYLELLDGRCAYCNRRTIAPMTADHVVPLTDGGRYDYTNILPACPSCNLAKADRPLAEFALNLSRWRRWRGSALGRIGVEGSWQWSAAAQRLHAETEAQTKRHSARRRRRRPSRRSH